MLTFSQWLKLREEIQPMQKLTPAQSTAQDATIQALQKTPLKPKQKISDLLKDPKQQSQLLQQVNQVAKKSNKPLNIGAVADTMDAKAGDTTK